ncbi:MAG: hypothetical protein PHC28_06775 [Flavobacterium sp.]|uniref:hypothetical protein n=1 Tax=Flavobacterium sp. TaxID=239 RepID=UPI00260F06C4|nr:hypothetical protein [Flavobacterium sp.]MDD5150174.1 hypothetical protein [Flavobacterium sp.]
MSELFFGKFQPPTKAHVNIIQQLLDPIVVVVYTNITIKKPFSKEIIEKMFFEYGIYPKFINTGYLPDILEQLSIQPEYLVCGSDRYKHYDKIIKELSLEIKLIEIDRNISDISSTKVRYALLTENEYLYRILMPYKFWNYFSELCQIYKNLK